MLVFFCEQTIVCFIINFYHNKLQEKKINFQKYALFFFLHDYMPFSNVLILISIHVHEKSATHF